MIRASIICSLLLLSAAAHAAGNATLRVVPYVVPALTVPVNSVAPVASGTATTGSTLSCSTGTWSDSPTFAYQWQRGGTNISGATAATYLLVTADGGTSVGCVVTATNAAGSGSQASNTLAITSGSVACLYAVDNGCAAAIVGQPGSKTVKYGRQISGGALQQLAGETGATQTDMTQNPNNINEPGVDYEVGSWMTTANLKDPMSPTNGIHITNPTCNYNATGGYNGQYGQFECTGNTALDIEDYDMSRGGTTCIPLSMIVGGGTGVTHIVKDNYWLNNGKCQAAFSGQAKGTVFYSNHSGGQLEFAYNTLDGNNIAFPYAYGSCSPPGSYQDNTGHYCNMTYMIFGADNVYLHHNFFKNDRSNLFQFYQAGTTFPLSVTNISYNMVQGCCATIPTDHAEYIGFQGAPNIIAAQSGGYKLIGNTWILTTDSMNNGNGMIVDQLHSMSFMPLFDIEDNFAILGTMGGASRQVVVGGNASGSTFTTSTTNAIAPETVGTFGSGEKVQCHVTGHDTDSFDAMAVYNGGTNTISAGPAGGGHSTPGNPVSSWAMTMYGGHATMGASLSGSTLTVSRPTITIQVGSAGYIPGVNLSYTVTALGTGTGGAGTYTVNVSGNQADEDGVQIFPFQGNQFPGGWTVAPGVSVPCYGEGWGPPSGTAPNRVATQRAIGFTNAAFVLMIGDGPGGPRGTTIVKRNTLDLWGYGPSANWSVNQIGNNCGNGDGSTGFGCGGPVSFNGTLNGTTLTCNSGDCAHLGIGIYSGGLGYSSGLLIGASWPGVQRGTYITSGTNGSGPFQVSKSYPSQVGPMPMQALQGICTDAPTVWGNNVAIDAVYPGYGNLNSWSGANSGSSTGC